MANQEIVNNNQSSEVEPTEHPELRYLTPAVDIYENDREYLLLADLPGVEPSNLDVQLEANELRVVGRLPAGDGVTHAYRRAFQVGSGIDPNGISAELKHGVLRLSAQKSAALKPRQIAVTVA